MTRAWLAMVLLVGACDVGEVDVPALAIADHAAGKDPCSDPAIRQRINVRAGSTMRP